MKQETKTPAQKVQEALAGGPMSFNELKQKTKISGEKLNAALYTMIYSKSTVIKIKDERPRSGAQITRYKLK
jgi:hypothetical protein